MQSIKYVLLVLFVSSFSCYSAIFNTVAISGAVPGNTQQIEGFSFKESPYVSAWAGKKRVAGDFGYYVQATLPLVTDEWRYTYTMLNGGGVYTISDHVSVFAGGGASFEEARYSSGYGYVFKTKSNNDTFNVNGGMLILVDGMGLSIGYNSASESVDFGVVLSF